MLNYCEVALPTSEGTFLALFNERGLCDLKFPGTFQPTQAPSTSGWQPPPQQVQLTAAALKQTLAGQPVRELPQLDLSAGTPFQQRVWAALAQIPPGQTRTYAEVAQAIGAPRATRAVGTACGANPIPLFIPCHRVLPKSGGLGGFTSGTAWKHKLLEREGVLLSLAPTTSRSGSAGAGTRSSSLAAGTAPRLSAAP